MTKVHEAIVDHLVDAILSGVYPSGSVLPNEGELAALHGVSRTAAREAMQRLGSLGMIESRRRKGATVLARESWKLLDPSLLSIAVLRVADASFFRSLLEARLLIEPRAAELAAQRASLKMSPGSRRRCTLWSARRKARVAQVGPRRTLRSTRALLMQPETGYSSN